MGRSVSTTGRVQWPVVSAWCTLLAGGIAAGWVVWWRSGSPPGSPRPEPMADGDRPEHPPLPDDPDAGKELDPEAARLRREIFAASRALWEAAPREVEPILIVGKTLSMLGRGKESEAWLRWGLSVDPGRADACESLGWAALQREEYESALQHWERAIRLGGGGEDLRYRMALAHCGLGRHDDAIEALRLQVAATPRLASAWFLLGQELLQVDRPDEAARHLRRAIALDPNLTGAHYGLARAAQKLGRKEEARASLGTFRRLKKEELRVLRDRNESHDDLVALSERISILWIDVGRVRRARGDRAGAEKAFRRAEELGSGIPEPRLEMASLLRAEKRDEEAARRYESLSRDFPRLLLPYLAVAEIHLRAGRRAEAERVLRRAVEIVPDHPEPQVELARTLLQSGRNPEEALRLASRAVDLEPSAPHFDLLGWARFANGDRGGAEAAIERAVALDPAEPAYRERLRKLTGSGGSR